MKLNLLISVLAGTAALLGLSACTSIQELPQEQLVEEVKNPEQAVCRELLLAFLENDAKKFVSMLPAETQKTFEVKQFERTRSDVIAGLGEPVSFQFVTRLEFVALTPHIWKIRFKRQNAQTGKEYYSEALFRIITGKADNKIHILSFNFL